MNKPFALAPLFVALCLSACASGGPSIASDVAAASGGGLIDIDEPTQQAYVELALATPATLALLASLESEGCESFDLPNVVVVDDADGRRALVEQPYECGGEDAPVVLTEFRGADADEAVWLASHRVTHELRAGVVERVDVLPDSVVVDRAPRFGSPSPEAGRVDAEGTAIADSCDAALIAAAFEAMQDSIDQCGPNTYSHAVPGEVYNTVQLLDGDNCRARVEQVYTCHDSVAVEFRGTPNPWF